MAALMIAAVAIGFTMDDLPQGLLRSGAFNVHKLVGAIVLALVAVRLAWRAGHPPPASDDVPTWQRRIADVAHGLLYALMIVMPVTGLLFTNFGKGIRIFGLALAPIGGANEALSHLFKEVHEASAIVLVTLVGAHALAALWHHFARRDATLARMLPRAT
jgi:cytochrome b561